MLVVRLANRVVTIREPFGTLHPKLETSDSHPPTDELAELINSFVANL